MTCPRSHSRLARWSGLQAPGQGFFCHTPILSRLWLTPYRPRESKCGLSFPPPQKRGAQCREAGIQEPLCAEARPRHVAPLPSRLLSLALVLMGRWEFPPPNLLLLSKPHTQGPDLLRNWQGRKQLEVWPKSKEQELVPPGFRPSLQLCQATNQGWQLWGRARGRGEALTASAASGLRGCRQEPARRKREEGARR